MYRYLPFLPLMRPCVYIHHYLPFYTNSIARNVIRIARYSGLNKREAEHPPDASFSISPENSQNINQLASTSNDVSVVEENIRSTKKFFQTGLATEVRLICIRLVKNQTTNGKISSFSAAVVVGNRNGGVGYGIAKDKVVSDALMKAGRLAERNMEYFDRYEDRTLFHDIEVKFKATHLIIRSMPAQSGRRCHWAIQEVCRCAGIQDISGKVYGSRNALNVLQAFFIALRRQKTPQQVAMDSGMKIVDVLKVYQYGKDYFNMDAKFKRGTQKDKEIRNEF